MVETKKTLVERLFAEHGRSLQAFLFRRVRKHPDAAELAQEVYVRMLRVRDMESVRNPEAYLYTVASNLAKEHARHVRRDGDVVDVDDPLIQEQFQ
jgi:DNA-directed RNA polymerase specialized sigma24 family protein